jgi:hypothetical protein
MMGMPSGLTGRPWSIRKISRISSETHRSLEAAPERGTKSGLGGHCFDGVPGAGVLDYVSAWYLKAPMFKNANPKITNALSFPHNDDMYQGGSRAAEILWRENHDSAKGSNQFRPSNLSMDQRSIGGRPPVHCVIVGFGWKRSDGKVPLTSMKLRVGSTCHTGRAHQSLTLSTPPTLPRITG